MSMDKQQFARAFAALENLQATALALKESVERLKQNALKNAEPSVNVADVARKIGQVIDQINMVLNEDGSSNNHN